MATTLELSGYVSSHTAVTFSGTQQLTSLADNEWTDLSDEITNTELHAFFDLELVLGSAAFTGTDCGIEIYIVQTVDGTNYPDWTGNSTSDFPGNSKHFATWLPINASTAAKRITTASDEYIPIPQGKFKFGVRSRANVSLASSGNTLSWRAKSFAQV